MKNFRFVIFIALALSIGYKAVSAQTANRFKTVDNIVLYYKIQGVGKPVLLLAGGPGYSGDYLQPVADEIAKYNQAILLDQRGTGKSVLSVTDEKTVNLNKYVADIEALRGHLKFEKLTILGHSFGGLMAMAYAAQHADHVEKLILVGSAGPNLDSFKYLQANINARLTASDSDALTFWSEPERNAANPERAAIERIRAIMPAYVYNRKNVLKIIEFSTPETYNHKVNQLLVKDILRPQYDLRLQLQNFKQPVLILQGRQDIIGESTAYTIHNTLGNSRLEFVEMSGHFPWLEQPKAFFPLIENFLTVKN